MVVANGFGANSDWVRNIEAGMGEEVTVDSQHFAASHRFLSEDEAMSVIQSYEHRNRYIAPIVRRGFSWLLGRPYHSGEHDRQRLVRQIPLIAFRPRSSPADYAPCLTQRMNSGNSSSAAHYLFSTSRRIVSPWP